MAQTPNPQQRNYIEREKQIRERNVRARAGGKALILSEDKIVDIIADRRMPTEMQHCIIKVLPKVSGSDKERFIAATNICQAVFQKNGYQTNGDTTLTPKGLKNNLRHRREVDNGFKESRYRAIEQRLWGGSVSRRLQERKDAKKNPSTP